MNNSKLIVDSVPLKLEETRENKPQLRERETQLVTIISALQSVYNSKGWSSLKTELFDGLTERLTKDITNEAKKEVPDALKLNRLAGQLKWAERYSDLHKLEQEFKTELANIKSLLYGKTEESG